MSDKPKNPFQSAFDRVMTMVADHQAEKLLRSYCMAMRPERKARLRAIIALSCELEKIRSVSIQATAFHEQIIEAIIEGDWAEAAKTDQMMLADPKSYDPDQAEMYRRLWENFRAILLLACTDAAKRAAGVETEPD